MAWFKVADERVRYRGRIDRAAFAAWLSTSDGADAIAEVAATIRFALFGRARAARKRLWRDLSAAAGTRDAAAVFAAAADCYARSLGDLAYASALPLVVAGLRRIVLVPRALVAGRARSAVAAQLGSSAAFSRMPMAVRGFLLEQVLREIDGAICAAQPSARRPVAAANGWVCVGVDTAFGWVDQMWSGPGWSGHFAVYERPPAMSRADRKAVERGVAQLQAGIQAFSRQRRHEVAHAAARA